MILAGLHHVCLVAGSYEEVRRLYVDLMGMEIRGESYSEEKRRRKVELYLDGVYLLEIFIYETSCDVPRRGDQIGFDHISFLVKDADAARRALFTHGYRVSPAMRDRSTGRTYAFFHNADGVKHEIYSSS